jgi:hypothetical protein
MHRTSTLIATLLIGIISLSYAAAQTPTTEPATRHIDASTPLAFMTSYDALAGEDPPAYSALYFVDDTDDVQRLAKVQAKFDAQVGMLQKIVQQKWGDDGVDQLLHALGLKSLRDIQTANIREYGRRATVQFADGTPGPDLIKVKDEWRLNMPAFSKSLGMPVDDYLTQIRQLAKILPDVADGIVDGKLKDPSAMVGDIAKRINAPAHQ